jgi:hypothetical protein
MSECRQNKSAGIGTEEIFKCQYSGISAINQSRCIKISLKVSIGECRQNKSTGIGTEVIFFKVPILGNKCNQSI